MPPPDEDDDEVEGADDELDDELDMDDPAYAALSMTLPKGTTRTAVATVA